MRQPGDIIKIQRVPRIARTSNVGVRPLRRQRQVITRVAMRQTLRQASALLRQLQSKVEFRRAQLQIVAPFAFGIKIVRHGRQQIPLGRGFGEIEDVLGRQQTLVGQRRIRRVKHLEAFREVRRQTSREIRTDLRSRRSGHKHRAMPDVLIHRVISKVGIVNLRQAPDIVIAQIVEVLKISSNPHLVVERFRIVVPHLLQPAQAERRFIREV